MHHPRDPRSCRCICALSPRLPPPSHFACHL
ncbi:hypothetical protein D7U70_01635 [Pseudomonas balearica]|nr:hypothetical protein [Stutzerimonas balearica]